MRTLWRCLRHPRAQLYAFDHRECVRHEIQCTTWIWFVVFAIVGTPIYALSIPKGCAGIPFMVFYISTGISWCLFGSALVLITRRRISTCAHACLVTMTYGIGVLSVGAGINVLLRPGPLFNALWVALSNVIMAAALVRQLATVGVRGWRTLATWVVFLDGVGAVLFWMFGGFQ